LGCREYRGKQHEGGEGEVQDNQSIAEENQSIQNIGRCVMKASEIEPNSWYYGLSKPKTRMLMRKWDGIRKNIKHMEETLLVLMNNPETTPEQLVMASKLYTNVTKQLHDHATCIDVFIYHGHKLVHMVSCPAYKTGLEDHCVCKDWQEGEM